MTEAAWQFTGYARLCGWQNYHPHDSRRSLFGWPDLYLVRRGVLVFAELRTSTGKGHTGEG